MASPSMVEKRVIATLYARFCPLPIHSRLLVTYWRWKNRSHRYPEPEYEVLSHFVRPGDLVVDAGTNMGQYASRLAELVGRDGRVIAFEAVPTTYRLAWRILASYPEVELHHSALSSAPGTVRMGLYVDAYGRVKSGLSAVVSTSVLGEASTTLEVQATTLDSVLKDRNRAVRFIKCDVEGHELQVLQGAGRLLMEDRPVILCEIHPLHVEAIRTYLQPLSYRLYQLTNDGLQPYFDLTRSNTYLVPSEYAVEKLLAGRST